MEAPTGVSISNAIDETDAIEAIKQVKRCNGFIAKRFEEYEQSQLSCKLLEIYLYILYSFPSTWLSTPRIFY